MYYFHCDRHNIWQVFLYYHPFPTSTTFRRSIHELREWIRNGRAGQALRRQASEKVKKRRSENGKALVLTLPHSDVTSAA